MPYSATVTSKRQITLPSKLFKRAKLKEGDKVVVTEENGVIKLESALSLVRKLAGSIKLPEKYKNMSTEEIIDITTKEYFSKIK